MDRVKIDLKHCYGIKELTKEFDFTRARAYAIYAPNGVMKTSFAQTFRDVVAGTAAVDRIFTNRASTRVITNEAGVAIAADDVLVVLSYDEALGLTKKTSTLLVNAKLRTEHEALTRATDIAKEAFLAAMKEQSGSKRDFEIEIATAFASDNFETALHRIPKEIQDQKDTPFADVKFDVIFDEKVVGALDTKDLKNAIEKYVQQYNELLAKSTYFKRGTFDYYNAGQIAKTLADNGFFTAKHTISLISPDGKPHEIRTRKELEEVIKKEKDDIIKDATLRKRFDDVETQLEKNITLRGFQKYLMDNEALLSRMNNIQKFKQDIFKSYIKVHENLYLDLMKKYAATNAGLKKIHEEAKNERTLWKAAIETFNQRFNVPFRLEAKNEIDLVLGATDSITLGFTYLDGAETTSIEKLDLVKVLSNGELKALYILNVIFEIATRTEASQETLVIVDDLADSFDYRNKYAIIQYLKEISEHGLFKLIIMTHNFDFFRTIESRFIKYANCLMASKSDDGKISLVPAAAIRNIFKDWRDNFFTDRKKKIACIPFLRNLAEFSKGQTDPVYLKLTSLLHWKADTPSITVKDLDGIFAQTCAPGAPSQDGAKRVCDLIDEVADECLVANIGVNFENKIVLAIATRLASERFMIRKINDAAFTNGIASEQTAELIKRFKKDFPAEGNSRAILDRVALMTPENIHLNSFMYEPIVDMSDEHLKKLYSDVKGLS